MSRVSRAGVGLFAAVVLAACSGGDGSTVDVDGLVKRAAEDGVTACPVPYDVTAAAKDAGITGAAAPSDGDAVRASSSESTSENELLKTAAPAAYVECSYTIGATEVKTTLAVTGKADFQAIGIVLPKVGAWAGLTRDELQVVAQNATAAAPGKVQTVPNGKAAVATLEVSKGTGVLVVAFDPADAFSTDQLTKLTEKLASQIH
jgi:hypothetical protein